MSHTLLAVLFALPLLVTIPSISREVRITHAATETTLDNQPTPPTYRAQQQTALKLTSMMLASVPDPPNCAVDRCVALTFDDGPDPVLTRWVVSILEREGVRSTFFILGNKVAGQEALLRHMQAEHFEIGNHSWDHKNFSYLGWYQINNEITQTDAALTAAGIQGAHLFRPPYGSFTQGMRYYLDWPLILWNVDPADWSGGLTPDQEVNAIVSHVRSGSIVVMHDTKIDTVRALPKIITDLKQKHYRLVTVSQLLQLPPGARGAYFSR